MKRRYTEQSHSKLTPILEACCVSSFTQITDKAAFQTALLTEKIEISYPYNVLHLIMSVSHLKDDAFSHTHFLNLYDLNFFFLMPEIM